MVVCILSAVKPGLRGELSRWMIEPHAGVFVGRISTRIRERLWDKIVDDVSEGSAILVYSARTEQGFDILVHGDRTRIPVDFDGITLIAQTVKRSAK